MVDLTDEELVYRVRTRDSMAFEQLYDRHVSLCFSLAAHILKDDTAAEGAVHDVFAELWEQPGRYSSDKGPLSTWLLSQVYRASLRANAST